MSQLLHIYSVILLESICFVGKHVLLKNFENPVISIIMRNNRDFKWLAEDNMKLNGR